MAKKPVPSRRASETNNAAGQNTASRRSASNTTGNSTRHTNSNTQAPPRRIAQERQAPSRRNDVIRCENCGEDYSVTYRYCPFCDERPGRTGVNGRRVDGGSTAHPVQVVGLALSLVLIIVALFIVFKYVGPLIFGRNTGDVSSGTSTSQSDTSSSSSEDGSQSTGDASGDQSKEVEGVQPLMLELSRVDFTLQYEEEARIEASVLPMDVTEPVVWTSSHPDVAYVDETGLVRNVNTGTEKIKTTITATCGDLTAECTVYCRPEVVAPQVENSTGTITGAGRGLNIRSGPGSDYDVVGSLRNGATVTVVEDAGNGWYKVKLSNGSIGYVSSTYVSIR